MKSMQKSILGVVCLLFVTIMLGVAWTTKRLTNNTGISSYPDIAVWGSNVYVVWQDKTSGNFEIYFRKSTDGGATWKATVNLSNNSEYSAGPAIAVSDLNVYVVWQDKTPGNFEIYFKKSMDGGNSWLSTKKLTNNMGYSGLPDIAASGSNAYVVWPDDNPGNDEIYFRVSTDSGTTWQSTKRLTNNTGESNNPKIAVNSPNVFVVWSDTTPGIPEIYFRKSTNNGATWQTVKNRSNNTGHSYNPGIAVINSDVYAVWDDNTKGNNEIYFTKSTDDGTHWQTVKRFAIDTGWSRKPAIAVRGSNVCVVWEDDLPGNFDIYFKKSSNGGATWQSTRNLSNNTGGSYCPKTAVNSLNVFVVWHDFTSGGSGEIYFTFSPL